MKVCFPISENNGLESTVYGHFGSAPGFVVVDMITSEFTTINNSDKIHEHGTCNPLAGLGGHEVDAIVVGGIGGGALHKLNSVGIRAFQASAGTIAENITLFRAGDFRNTHPAIRAAATGIAAGAHTNHG